MNLDLDATETAALKDAAMEMLQEDAEKLECPEWIIEDPDRALYVAERFGALTGLIGKLKPV